MKMNSLEINSNEFVEYFESILYKGEELVVMMNVLEKHIPQMANLSDEIYIDTIKNIKKLFNAKNITCLVNDGFFFSETKCCNTKNEGYIYLKRK